MDTRKDDTRRRKYARAALKAYPGTDTYDLRSSIIDLMVDLMHLAEGKRERYEGEFNVERIVTMAQEHFRCERRVPS